MSLAKRSFLDGDCWPCRYSVVAGGFGNHAKGHRTGVLGGFRNSASGTYSTIGGGEVNHALGDYSFVAGGTLNTALGVHSSVLGSYGLANHNFSAVLGFSGEVCEAQGPTTGGSVTVCTKVRKHFNFNFFLFGNVCGVVLALHAFCTFVFTGSLPSLAFCRVMVTFLSMVEAF